ncbi:hypothetical protein G6F62_000806 [Rhizopus arrhizus]|nr:hypothetical protein G6F23_002668 [Rhizopus arrhizus]KAG0768568.1 hypothetical protein G6F24_001823 [Rhizopus arrhizus]KAG0795267.1 hypothetical protein G6F21_002234 [Rhizopus arrhizus]KAG0801498.1 hypothetical protein G6F22_001191 [Rhizopus arrhizus]KAG0816617.1 hypothetical protein G6F20_003055 [Rhizopus arrhizus]
MNRNCSKALATMNVLTSIGVNSTGFSKLLSSRFYAQIVRPQMEYGLAINLFSNSQLQQLEYTQNRCIWMIYSAHDCSSTKVMLHLANLPTMNERVRILQAQFLFRSLYVPDDSLLGHLLPHVQHIRGYQWPNLSKTALWQRLPTPHDNLTIRAFRSIKQDYLQHGLRQRMHGYGSKLLSLCPAVFVGALVGYLEVGPGHAQYITSVCSLSCMLSNASVCITGCAFHYRPQILCRFLLNKLPTGPRISARYADSWRFYWPIICSILSELDQLQHGCLSKETTSLGRRFLRWLENSQ